MKTEKKKSILKGVFLGGMIAGVIPAMADANSLLDYNIIGSGAELRSGLLEQYGSPVDVSANLSNDFIVGETKCGESKCGESKGGKEGEANKKTKKSETKKDEVKAAGKTESKATEAKCGEEVKKEAKSSSSESKTSESKCGENTCGGE